MKSNNRHEKSAVENFLLILSCAVITLIVSFFLVDAETTKAKNPLRAEIPLEQKLKKFKPEGKEIGDNMLIENDRFKVTYLISHQEFFVLIKKGPVAETRREVEAWFGVSGFAQGEICRLKVSLVPGKELLGEFSEADTKLPSCP